MFKDFEYDEKQIKRCLEVWEFNTEEIPFELINHVPMHGFKISSKEKPLLFVDNLQCCVALFAYAPNFGFMSHINTLVMRGGDYEVDENNSPIKCRRTEDLYSAIINSGITFNQPIKLGLSIGCNPIGETHPSMQLINNGINEVIKKLQSIGISSYLAPNEYEMNFILDTRDGTIIKPSIVQTAEFENTKTR